jgi:type I restriction-modification system DNA methylase subunit/predicted type IV restriction endonuclease/small nuclear ribonucleoprotein (snRNP)-like protein
MNITKESAREKIRILVDRFAEHVEEYKRKGYNEHQTRIDYINPFFKALGWDIDNEQGFAEAYREVIHEDKVKVGSATKAPDYAFTLFGQRKFFVDAKKPSVNIKDDLAPAYQVRRYGWSAKVPISIVTDFEEFSIYDCTKKPNPKDKASIARIKYLTFDKYIDEFDFLWDVFAKENLPKGRYDKYVQSDTRKKGTATVDEEFLKSIEEWRRYLATSIALQNKSLDEDELNFAVQRIIDRIIFLRFCEDRGVEPYGELKRAAEKGDVYQNLFHLFRVADEKYNSGLFDLRKDTITPLLSIQNKPLKVIIKELYYPHSEFEFSVMPADILGSVYERFLGKTIRLTPAHYAKIEEKPEVRKAGGVYYTPKYIVDYIVENTIGNLLKGKAPKQVSSLKICDPACGSGSFLIGAYQYLLDWHLDFYLKNAVNKKKENPLTPDNKLTTAEKRRILINNIYGVDIDVQAVEVTKLNLLLKAMEGETQSSINQQLSMFHERVLPNLGSNIKSGNSLIDTDYYDGQIDYGDEKKIKPFNWKRAFPDVFGIKEPEMPRHYKIQFQKVKNLADETDELIRKLRNEVNEPGAEYEGQGFDVILGNPPYGALFTKDEINYFKILYQTAVWRGESYLMFIERGLKLLKNEGLLGFIIPDTILNLGFTQPTREFLLRNSQIKEVVGLSSRVFAGATVDTIILLTQKSPYSEKFNHSNVLVKVFGKKQVITKIEHPKKEFYIKAKQWFEQNNFNIHADNNEIELLKKMLNKRKTIADIAVMHSGIKVYSVGRGTPVQTEAIRKSKPYTSDLWLGEDWSPFFDGKHIGRYQVLWNKNNWIKYGANLAEPRKQENFLGEKILIRKITGRKLIGTYVPYDSYCNTLLHVLKIKDESYTYNCVLALLNSSLIGWFFRKHFQISDDDTFPQIMIRDILQFPVPEIDLLSENELNKQADQLLILNDKLKKASLQSQKDQLTSHIQHCETRIDELVYGLFNLTDEEIRIVDAD